MLPYFGSGGADKMVAQLAAGISREAYQTEVFCVYGEPQGNHMEQLLQSRGVPVHYIRKGLGFSVDAMYRLFRELNAFNPDVIHTHLYACLYAFPWPLLRRKPFLHTFHLPPELENKRFLRRVISKILIGAKVMTPVAISNRNQKFLCAYYGLSEKQVPVVYNPVELSKFNASHRTGTEVFTFITAGRFSAQKNQKMMYRAFAEFLKKGYDARLVMLGRGEEEENLKTLACELDMHDRIDYPGFVPNVEDYLTNADVFLLSSDYEALPLAVLEAMAAGLPIISTDVGGVCDIVTDNGILIRAGDVDAMVRAMEKLYLDADVHRQMATASIRNVQAYDVSNTVSGYCALYIQCADKK